jgi:hypothetical protein
VLRGDRQFGKDTWRPGKSSPDKDSVPLAEAVIRMIHWIKVLSLQQTVTFLIPGGEAASHFRSTQELRNAFRSRNLDEFTLAP